MFPIFKFSIDHNDFGKNRIPFVVFNQSRNNIIIILKQPHSKKQTTAHTCGANRQPIKSNHH